MRGNSLARHDVSVSTSKFIEENKPTVDFSNTDRLYGDVFHLNVRRREMKL